MPNSNRNFNVAIFEKYENLFHHKFLYIHDTQFMESVVLANYVCSKYCPLAVIRPVNISETSLAVKMINDLSLNLVIRGGGHSYTCQSAKGGDSIMIDMRHLKSIKMEFGELHGSNVLTKHDTITVGTGLTWQDVLTYLDQRNYITVHGQCTSVGVAGFSLHGGVHFGGLSEIYGLSSDNVVGLTAVLANSSELEIRHKVTSSENRFAKAECYIDKRLLKDSIKCNDLLFAFRGAGSSYGVVTSITIKIFRKPVIQTALSILSLNLHHLPERIKQNDKIVPNDISTYLYDYFYANLPQKDLSITLFGLDAYFKAFFFLQVFSDKTSFQNILNTLNYDLQSFFRPNTQKEHFIHFIVEASWLSSLGAVESHLNNWNKNNDFIYQQLQSLHSNLHSARSNDRSGWRYDWVKIRPWIHSSGMWSVPSYDLVWGEGHSYGGASIMTNNAHFHTVTVVLEQYLKNMKNNACDDCVAVIHRVGEGLRKNRDEYDDVHPIKKECTNIIDHIFQNNCKDKSNKNHPYSTSFHPFRHQATVWIEIDCGHFHRHRKTWPKCQAYIEELQFTLDHSTNYSTNHLKSNNNLDNNIDDIDSSDSSSAQYPNVPNLNTNNWKIQYYGKLGYERLIQIKHEWDPHNLFSHVQSIIQLQNNNNNNNNNRSDYFHNNNHSDLFSNEQLLCQNLYDKKLYKPYYQFLIIIIVFIIISLTRLYVLPSSTSEYLLRKRMKRKNRL